MKRPTTWLLLALLLLLLTLALSAEDDATASVAATVPIAATTGTGAAWPRLPTLMPRTLDEPPHDWPLFDAYDSVAEPVEPALPAPVAVAASARLMPVIPVLPLAVLGSYHDGSRHAVFLLDGEDGLVAHVGTLLKQAWRVDDIDDMSMTLRHLPSGQQQRMVLWETP